GALGRERGGRGLRQGPVKSGIDRLDELMTPTVERVDRPLRLRDDRVVGSGIARSALEVPLLEVAEQEIDDEPEQTTLQSALRVAHAALDPGHDLSLRRDILPAQCAAPPPPRPST